MKKTIAILLSLFALTAFAQKHEITIRLEKPNQEKLYIAQHFRDELRLVDSARLAKGGKYLFNGKARLQKGIYALVDASGKKAITDFTIDGGAKFTLYFDSTLKASGVKVTGSEANRHMFEYIAKNDVARSRARQLDKDKKSKDEKVRKAAEQEMESLSKEMVAYEKDMAEKNKEFYFFRLQQIFGGPEVPESVADKAVYYRTHYWDGIDLKDHSLIYTPDLFNKMNYYFFGVLYYADADTICHHADRVLHSIDNDPVMLQYFLEFIMPKYYRSTKNIGWDQVWCHLVREFYLSGKCTFATPADIANKRQTCEFLERSLIGAMGAELVMADTNQSSNSEDWISSHRLPNKYVILWFWDPDCHHCQEQTATLITLYDSLAAAHNPIFEVYAVGYESDVAKWKRYVKEHNLPFINVGGPNVNIDYQEAYNIHGAPTMIILNADRQIIMNKTLPTNSILPFIREYEKSHPEQANRPPSRWQQMGMTRKAGN